MALVCAALLAMTIIAFVVKVPRQCRGEFSGDIRTALSIWDGIATAAFIRRRNLQSAN
jgi:hypothetical protein